MLELNQVLILGILATINDDGLLFEMYQNLKVHVKHVNRV